MNKKGFTLIEISIAVVLLVMLAVLVIPGLVKNDNKTKEKLYNAKINEARQLPGFAGCDKKFKAGKVSKKTGEEISPDTYTAVVKLNH